MTDTDGIQDRMRVPTPPPVDVSTRANLDDVMGPPDREGCLYEQVKVIGSGSFGEAWLVRRKKDKVPMVAKLLDLTKMSKRDQKYVESEIQCLAACHHFAIVKFEQSFVADPKILIVMEFADAGDLNTQIKARAKAGFKYFEEHEIGYTFVQLCMALDHVHRNKMLHRDIKGANVLLMSSGLIKLGDFGFSQQYEDTVSGAVAETFCGTPYYLAPELWKRQKYSKKADIWSLGILLYEMMALQRPFVGQTQKAVMAAVLKNDLEPLPPHYTKELRDVVELMLQRDPDRRPSMAQLFQVPYMQKLLRDFEKSATSSPNVDDATKELIRKSAAEARSSSPEDSSHGSAVTTSVGSLNKAVSHEGLIRKESNRVWKERYLVLKDGELIIAVKKGDDNTRAVSVTTLASVVPVPYSVAKAEGVFALNTLDNKTMWMQAPSSSECGKWIHRIQQAMGVA